MQAIWHHTQRILARPRTGHGRFTAVDIQRLKELVRSCVFCSYGGTYRKLQCLLRTNNRIREVVLFQCEFWPCKLVRGCGFVARSTSTVLLKKHLASIFVCKLEIISITGIACTVFCTVWVYCAYTVLCEHTGEGARAQFHRDRRPHGQTTRYCLCVRASH